MQKIRILGSRSRLAGVIETLQDFGAVHLSRPTLEPPVVALRPSARGIRHAARVEVALGDVEEALARLGDGPFPSPDVATPMETLPREVRLARRARRSVVALAAQERALVDERERLAPLQLAVEAFVRMGVGRRRESTRTFLLVLPRGAGDAESRLEGALTAALGESFALSTEPLSNGDLAVALAVPLGEADRVEALLPEAGVVELELPKLLEPGDLASGLRALQRRGAEIEEELELLTARRRRLAAWLRPGLLRARRTFNDWLVRNAALSLAAATSYLFVLEGWLPAGERDRLARALHEREGEGIVVEDIEREDWSARDVPVAIRNPRIFQPFEVITSWMPLPRYGTMDPTPFVALFFPMFFGVILGDLGYGALLAVLAAVGWRRSREGTPLRSISEIAGACAVFSMSFGLFFGELFGDLGHRLFDLHAVAFSREKAIIPFLLLSLAIGLSHVILGLVLGVFSNLRDDPRASVGRGLAAVMLLLTAALALVAVNVLPDRFFTPLAVALILIFPVLIAIEGVLGAVELLSRVSNVLSYARIMALGTASVMLAIVANEMVGTFGGAVVGVLFATLFHLVNFGLGVFSPTIHALRLHFVEFFGTFYSPGGQVYRPFRHWRLADAPTQQSV